MGTLREEVRERKSGIRDVKKGLRSLDTIVEKTERYLNQILSRKRGAPEMSDLEKIIGLIRGIEAAVEALIKLLEALAVIFRI